eukprot:s1701_g4.t1
MFLACRACLLAVALAGGTGPWPHGPVDVMRLNAMPNLRDLFDWHAEDGHLDEKGLVRLLRVQRESDGFKQELPSLFTRAVRKTIFNMSTNATLQWDDFHLPYQHYFFPNRKRWLDQLTVWSCLHVQRQTLPAGAHHYRYLPKTESRFQAEFGRTTVEWCKEHVRYRKRRNMQQQQPQPPPPPPGGYHEESMVLSATAMLPRGCGIWGATQNTVHCYFPRKNPELKGRLAVLVTGIKDRYYPRSSFRHVVMPAAQEGYEVDYYALLDWQPTVAPDQMAEQRNAVFNPGQIHTKREGRSVSNPQLANASLRQGLSLVSRLARAYGASRLYLQFLQPGLKEDPPWHGCNRYLGRGTALHIDYRRTRFAYKNVEFLWNISLQMLQREGLASYTHVLWQREDVHWVSDMHLDLCRDPWAVYGRVVSNVCKPEANHPREVYSSDKVFLAGGEAARSFFKLYDLVNCGNPGHELSQVVSPEEFVIEAARVLGLKFHEVPWISMPYIIARHMKIYGQADIDAVFCLKFSRSCLFRPGGSFVSAIQVPYRGCEDISDGLHDQAFPGVRNNPLPIVGREVLGAEGSLECQQTPFPSVRVPGLSLQSLLVQQASSSEISFQLQV